MGNIQDGALQIHMIIHGECLIQEETSTLEEGGEMIHIEEHFREIIGLIDDGLIAMLVGKYGISRIMMIILMNIGVILIIAGIILKSK